MRFTCLYLALCACSVGAFERLLAAEEPLSFLQSKKGDGFDGFGTPDPFNQNDDDQVDAGEPNAPDQENPNDDANMVSDDDADDDDSFVEVASKVTKKGDGFDGFGTPDPFNQNDDDQVDAGEPNAPDQENPNDDANMVSDDDADDDDSFVQVASKVAKGDGFDGFGTPDPFNQNDDDQVDAGEPNAPDQENPNDDANMVSDDDADDDDSFVQVASKVAKGDGFDGFGTPDPFNQNDDDQVDAGEPNAPDQENPNDDANMVSDDDADDDDSFVQVASKVAKGDGFDGFGTPDPFNQNDDDQVDAGEPNAPDQENPNDDANMVSDDDADDDDSFVQVASKVAKGDGFDGFGTPDPFNQNDDDQVDAGEPNAPDQENPNDDANMVSDDDADDDDSFVQVASKVAKGDGFDGFGTPDPFNQNDDDQVDAGEPNAPDQENPNDDANMVSDDDADDDDSFVQVASKVAKGDGFDGFGTPDPFNQNDDDQVDAGEPNAPDQENPNDDANMVSDDDADDDDSFVQVASKVAKGDGFDGFGTPDPFNQNDDDQVDAGEPNAPDQENPNDDANMVSDDDADDDDSFVQSKSRHFLSKSA